MRSCFALVSAYSMELRQVNDKVAAIHAIVADSHRQPGHSESYNATGFSSAVVADVS